jgi:hypothetical protein
MQDYTELPGLENVYLEDSWVLGIAETADSLTFTLEAVLTPEHPRYVTPPPDEQHCYVDAVLTFTGAREIRWLSRSDKVATDATGQPDHGNIDALTHEGDHYALEGDWGRVEVVTGSPPRFDITSHQS